MPKKRLDFSIGKELLRGTTSFLGEGKKSKRKPMPKAVREQVWETYIGKTKRVGKCYCCEWRPITESDFEVAHNKAVAKGGKDNVSNLRPICKQCNRSIGTKSIESYKKKYHGKPTKTKKKPKAKPKKKEPASIFDLPETKSPFRLP